LPTAEFRRDREPFRPRGMTQIKVHDPETC